MSERIEEIDNSKKMDSNSNELFLAVSLGVLFIFFMTYIQSGIIVALFFLIWCFGMLFTIIIIFRNDYKTDLKEMNRDIKENGFESERINLNFILIKRKNELIIRNEGITDKKGSLYGLIITLVATVPIFILAIIYQVLEHQEIRDYSSLMLILLIFIIPFNIIWIIAYFFYRHRRTEWRINKKIHKIVFKKISPFEKTLKELNFSEILNISYDLTDNWSMIYSSIIYNNIEKRLKIFNGEKLECIELSLIIAKFIEKPFYDKETNVSFDPNYYLPWYNLAKAKYENKKYEDTFRIISYILEREPNNLEMRKFLEILLEKKEIKKGE